MRTDVVKGDRGELVRKVVEPREASGEQGVGADAEVACGHPDGEGTVRVDLEVAFVRVRLVEGEASGDGPPSGENFDNDDRFEPSW